MATVPSEILLHQAEAYLREYSVVFSHDQKAGRGSLYMTASGWRRRGSRRWAQVETTGCQSILSECYTCQPLVSASCEIGYYSCPGDTVHL